MSGANSQEIEIPRKGRSGFRRAALTPRERLKFSGLSSQTHQPWNHGRRRPINSRVWQQTALRWLKFNFVGGIGIAVQLAALVAIRSVFHVDYLVATVSAVEIAVLHNFLWHERFTWAERQTHRIAASLARLVRFNLSNGAVSIVGNLLLMRLLVGRFHVHYVAANLVAIAVCSVTNFLLSEHIVFRQDPPVVREGSNPR